MNALVSSFNQGSSDFLILDVLLCLKSLKYQLVFNSVFESCFWREGSRKDAPCLRAAPNYQLSGNDLKSISNLMGKGWHVCCRVTADKCALFAVAWIPTEIICTWFVTLALRTIRNYFVRVFCVKRTLNLVKDLPTFRGLQPPENILFDVIDGSFLRYHFRLLNAQEEESTVSTQNVAYVKNILLFSLSNNWCKINSKMPNASTARIMAFYTKCKILPGTVGVYIDLTALETLLIWALHMMPTK